MKNSIIYKIAFTVFTLLSCFDLIGQEQPIRGGVKVGLPNGLGGHVEYVSPLLGGRLAGSFEYSSFKFDKYIEPDQGNVNYWEAGLNYYFGKDLVAAVMCI